MFLQTIFSAVETLSQGLPALFSNTTFNFAFGEHSPCIGDWSNPSNIGILVSGDGVGSQSGVYFFADPNGKIIYIGKATKNNLHQRVWDHVKTPYVMPDGTRTFPKHGFKECSNASAEIELIRSGNARLGVITVSNPDLVSLVEVYLHTLFVKEYGCLPVLNKQIG